MHAKEDDRAATSAFLAAAQAGDIAAADAYLIASGDVNATLGERWTALHYAVARGHVVIVDRLLHEDATNLNALTIVGTSALGMAIGLHNNVIARMLLDGGASRATVSHDQLREAWDSSWIWPEVRRRLDPSWSIVWSHATLHRFSRQEQQKYHLILIMNHWSGQRGWAGCEGPNLSSGERVQLMMSIRVQQIVAPDREQNDVAPSPLAWILKGAWRRIAGGRIEEERPAQLAKSVGNASVDAAVQSHWRYLPPVVLQHVLEYALFLW